MCLYKQIVRNSSESGEGSNFQRPQLPQLPQLPSNLPSLGDVFGSFLSLLPQNGLGDIFGGGGSNFAGQIPQLPQNRPINNNTPKPAIPVTTTDPDDTIYNDDSKPVNEDYDPVVPDKYTNLQPGQYITASNPIFGQFTTQINPQKFFNGVGQLIDEFVD